MEIKSLTTKTVQIILAIDDKVNYQNEIGRRNHTTFGAVFKILKILEENNFITSENSGRKKLICLTKKGERLKYLLTRIKEL